MSSGTRYSLLPALTLDGIIYSHTIEGSFTAGLFYDFIEGFLAHMQPYPAPCSVIIMDNCRIHHDPHVLIHVFTYILSRQPIKCMPR